MPTISYRIVRMVQPGVPTSIKGICTLFLCLMSTGAAETYRRVFTGKIFRFETRGEREWNVLTLTLISLNRENPAQIHRLMGWLNREIIYLLNSAVHYNSFVLQTIEERITQHDMTSRAFRQHLQPFFTRHTSHFLHELINFARSPYDIIGYDRNVQYRPHFYDIEIESVSIDSDRSDPSPRLSPRSDVTTEDPYMSNESQHNSQSRSVIVFGSNGEGSSRNFTTPSSYTFQPITEPVTVDTDDSDDCL